MNIYIHIRMDIYEVYECIMYRYMSFLNYLDCPKNNIFELS